MVNENITMVHLILRGLRSLYNCTFHPHSNRGKILCALMPSLIVYVSTLASAYNKGIQNINI